MISRISSALRQRLVSLPARAKVTIAMSADLVVLYFVAVFVAHILGGRGGASAVEIHRLLLAAPIAVVAAMLLIGSYRVVVRFGGVDIIGRCARAVFVVSLLLGVATLLRHRWTSAVEVALLFGVSGFSGLVLLRRLAQRFLRPMSRSARTTNVVIYGAGSGGIQLASALMTKPEYSIVSFVDDDRRLQGRTIRGIRIAAPDSLADTMARGQIDRILLAIPSLSSDRRRQILEFLEPLSVTILVMPGLDELASGAKRVDDMRVVQIEDLLARDPVPADDNLLHQFIRGKSVMVTGAGGSIGSELCRQAVRIGARKLVMFEVSEFALYSIDQELRAIAASARCEIVPVLGTILDEPALRRCMREHAVETVYHAAAYKHVPMVESNVVCAVRNNVLGTLASVNAAADTAVQNFVLISTDKAVRPTSVMGASKRVCELIVQARSAVTPQMRMSMVRFGNVLGSSGSVVPLFREQIARGGPITVTHPEVTRYFMTIPEAAQLVIQAGSMGRRGEVFVLDMGQSVRIMQLAERMVHLSGLTLKSEADGPGDIEIRITGLRPGEKLYEELLIGDQTQASAHPRISLAQETYLDWEELERWLADLDTAVRDAQAEVVKQLLANVVQGYCSTAVEPPESGTTEGEAGSPASSESHGNVAGRAGQTHLVLGEVQVAH